MCVDKKYIDTLETFSGTKMSSATGMIHESFLTIRKIHVVISCDLNIPQSAHSSLQY